MFEAKFAEVSSFIKSNRIAIGLSAAGKTPEEVENILKGIFIGTFTSANLLATPEQLERVRGWLKDELARLF